MPPGGVISLRPWWCSLRGTPWSKDAIPSQRAASVQQCWGEEEIPGEIEYQVISQASDTVMRVKARLETVENIASPRLLEPKETEKKKSGQP